MIARPPAPAASTRPCPPLGRPLAAPYSGRITRPFPLRPQRVAHSVVGRMCGLHAAHSAVLAAWIGSGCAAEPLPAVDSATSAEAMSASATDTGSPPQGFIDEFDEIPEDTTDRFACPEGSYRPEPDNLGPEVNYIPCATSCDCYDDELVIDFGPGPKGHFDRCDVVTRPRSACHRATVGTQRYTACLPRPVDDRFWIGAECGLGWESVYPQCDICERTSTLSLYYSGGSATPPVPPDDDVRPEEYELTRRAFPSYQGYAKWVGQSTVWTRTAGPILCTAQNECPRGLGCVCLDDERTVYLGVGDPANELYFCLAGEPGCRCRDNGSDLAGR